MTSLQKYELLILAVPEITQDETKDLEKQVHALVKKRKGSLVSFDRWGKYRLAYPVKKNDYGVYLLVRFDAPTNKDLNGDITSLFKIKFDTVVMRSMLSTLDVNASADYMRPRSLEEAPTSASGSILKNKKVEGLISAVDATTRSVKKEAAPKEETTKEKSKIEKPELSDSSQEDTDESPSAEA